jgi:hypothetical protein
MRNIATLPLYIWSRIVYGKRFANAINSMSNAAETDLLNHYFNNSAIANVGDAVGLRGSSSAGSFYIALHTADPGETGDQTTSEATFTGYARVAVARSSGGWTISGNTVSNTAAINFAACTGGSNTITYFSVGVASSGASVTIVSGALTASLAVSNGITPSFAIGALTATCD